MTGFRLIKLCSILTFLSATHISWAACSDRLAANEAISLDMLGSAEKLASDELLLRQDICFLGEYGLPNELTGGTCGSVVVINMAFVISEALNPGRFSSITPREKVKALQVEFLRGILSFLKAKYQIDGTKGATFPQVYDALRSIFETYLGKTPPLGAELSLDADVLGGLGLGSNAIAGISVQTGPNEHHSLLVFAVLPPDPIEWPGHQFRLRLSDPIAPNRILTLPVFQKEGRLVLGYYDRHDDDGLGLGTITDLNVIRVQQDK